MAYLRVEGGVLDESVDKHHDVTLHLQFCMNVSDQFELDACVLLVN